MSSFKDRFEAIQNIEELLKAAAPQYQDPKEYYRQLIENEPNQKLAERRLRILEDLSTEDEQEKLELQMSRIRRERDEMLKNSDWSQLADAPLSAVEKKKYRKYREFLRDLPVSIKTHRVKPIVYNYTQWEKWLESIRHTPGYEKYVV